MLAKLTFKNVGKCLKDYVIYFLTLVFGVSIFYMFNSIYAQADIMKITESLHDVIQTMTQILGIVSIFVAVILGFVIIYANRLFVKRRKKELGVYMILGMNKWKISIILILETSVIAVVALVSGLVLGILGAQYMSIFTARIFEADMTKFTFIFAPEAVLKSILYFGLIFIVVILFNTLTISKLNLIDLLYANRVNEKWKVKKLGVAIINMVLALSLIGIAYIIILNKDIMNSNILFILAILFGTIGTFLFFFSFARVLIHCVKSNKNLFFKDLNMFILRQLSSKINTNYITMSIVCIVLFLTIGIFSSGYSLQNILSKELQASVPFDVSYYDFGDDDLNNNATVSSKTYFANLIKFLKNNEYIEDYRWFPIYFDSDLRYGNLNISVPDNLMFLKDQAVSFIKLSDYNSNLKMQGLKTLDLKYNQYAIIATNGSYVEFAKNLIQSNTEIKLAQQQLKPYSEIQKVSISNNSEPIMFVVNDSEVKLLTCIQVVLNLNCKQGSALQFEEQTKQFANNDYSQRGFGYSISKIEMYKQSVSNKAIISFLAIYLGIVFMMTATVILAIQQVSEATDNKERYALLGKLGVEKRDINKALFIQILCYFLLPLILAVIHSAVGLTVVNRFIRIYGNINLTSSIIVTALVIIALYGGYFAITYIVSKNIIRIEGQR